MKKIFLAAVAAFISVTAFAQQGDFKAGLNLVYGSEIENPGIGVKAQYYILDEVRPEASFTYFFKKDGLKLWDINANLHYLFDLGTVAVYPLAGINYSHVSADFGNNISASEGKIGANIGGGIEYPLNDAISLGAEVKYTINNVFDNGQVVIGVGCTFKF